MSLPAIVPWSDLKPGDLAWDPGDGDLVTHWFAPLLLVDADGAGWWYRTDGDWREFNPLTPAEYDHANLAAACCPWAVLLARGVAEDSAAIVRAVAEVADAALAIVRLADLEGHPVADAETRKVWPHTATLPSPIGEETVLKHYRWRVETYDAGDSRLVAEHRAADKAGDPSAWRGLRNPSRLAELLALTPEGT